MVICFFIVGFYSLCVCLKNVREITSKENEVKVAGAAVERVETDGAYLVIGGKNEIQIKQDSSTRTKESIFVLIFISLVGHDRMQASVARCFEVQL